MLLQLLPTKSGAQRVYVWRCWPVRVALNRVRVCVRVCACVCLCAYAAAGREVGCAWCLGARRCVEDKAWACTGGEEDHVGAIGTIQSCPDPAVVKAERDERKAREAAQEEEERAARASAGGAADGAEDGAEKSDADVRADEAQATMQRDELERLRQEFQEVESGQGATKKRKEAAHRAELLRKLALIEAEGLAGATDPYEILGVEADVPQQAIRKAYKKLTLA